MSARFLLQSMAARLQVRSCIKDSTEGAYSIVQGRAAITRQPQGYEEA
jgi:hypothetical protein